MTTPSDLFLEAFGRVNEGAHGAIEGLSASQAAVRLEDEANSVAWLIWHVARTQDHYAAELTGSGEVWVSGGWVERFGLPFGPEATGYGQSGAEVAAVRAPIALLAGYLDAAHGAITAYVARLDETALDDVVDESYDPPVTLAVRLVSIVEDNLQHVGQAALVRGILKNRGV